MAEPITIEQPPKQGLAKKLRTKFWNGTAALVLAGSGGAACAPDQAQSTNTHKSPRIETTVDLLSVWQQKAPMDRILDLESIGFELGGMDRRKELVSASAEFFCSKVPCPLTPEELAQKTVFLDGDAFIKEYEKDSATQLTPDQIAYVRTNIAEFVSQETRLVYFNNDSLLFIEADIRAKSPDVVAKLNSYGIDLRTMIEGSILLHANTHAITNQPAFEFSGFNLTYGSNNETEVVVNRFEDMIFEGESQSGEKLKYSGFAEAATEYIATWVGTQKGIYMNIGGYYGEGADMLSLVNEVVGVPVETFIKYYTGELPMEEYFKLVGERVIPGASDAERIAAGASLLGGIAVAVNGYADLYAVEDEIYRRLGLST